MTPIDGIPVPKFRLGAPEVKGQSSYVAQGLNGTGFSSGPGQAVPHGGGAM